MTGVGENVTIFLNTPEYSALKKACLQEEQFYQY